MMMEHPLYNEYNSYYKHVGCYNGSLGRIYNNRKNKVYPIACKLWTCPKCRKIKKYNLFLEVYYMVMACNLDRHLIITFKGKKYRDKYTYKESYYILSNLWNKYKKMIEYHKGRFDYICFNRSQSDGYSHLHILIPKYIGFWFLHDRKKKYEEMGSVRIHRNPNVAEYLHTDFLKDSEYWIPKGIKNYRSSRGIKFNKYKEKNFEFENSYIIGKHTTNELENLVLNKFGRLLPNEYYLREFFEKNESGINNKNNLEL